MSNPITERAEYLRIMANHPGAPVVPFSCTVLPLRSGTTPPSAHRCVVHISKVGDRWRVIVQHKGQRRSAYAPTRGEAQSKGAEMLIGLGNIRPQAEVTVAELMAAWLAKTEATHKPTYHLDLVSIMRRVPDSFMLRPVADVGPLVIDMLHRELRKKGFSAHRIARVHRALGTAWRDIAIPYGWATTNPLSIVRTPAAPPAKVTAPDATTVRRLLAAADGQFRLYLELAARTGARRGEVIGLQWGDIGKDQLVIRRSVADLPGRRTIIGDTKTGKSGQRVIALDPMCIDLLRKHRLAQIEKRLAAGLPGEPTWVFSFAAGEIPWRGDYVTRQFNRTRRAQGIEGVRLHDLRHFVASQLLASGVPLRTVSGRLGHTRISTTSDVYSHYVPAADQTAATTISDILGLG